MAESKTPIYPHFAVKNNHKPNKWYAFPFLGMFVKLILLIPVFIEGFFLTLAFLFFWIGNGFVVLFTGKYWDSAYDFFLKFMRFSTKISLYIFGITDKYPGFNLTTNGLFTLDIPKPAHPNRFLAMPLLGPLVRFLLLIPYLVFSQVMQNGSSAALVVSWFAVLFTSKFPESLYEFEHDTIRISLASTAYFIALSDKYPSFSISMDHQNVKIALLIVGALVTLNDGKNAFYNYKYNNEYRHRYNNSYDMNQNDWNRRDNYQNDWRNSMEEAPYNEPNTY